MSTRPEVPEVHYWKLDMPREAAAKYTQDLCGSEGTHYTEVEEEVTCERCLAALRGRSRPPQAEEAPSAPAGVARAPLEAGSEIRYVPGDVAEQVRAAVLKERLAIIDLIVQVQSDVNIPRPLVVRRILERIGKRE